MMSEANESAPGEGDVDYANAASRVAHEARVRQYGLTGPVIVPDYSRDTHLRVAEIADAKAANKKKKAEFKKQKIAKMSAMTARWTLKPIAPVEAGEDAPGA